MGHTVVLLGDGREFLDKVLADPPDFVFNFAEGRGISRAREARVPAVLEMLGIPFSGSDPFTLAVTLDKDCAKKLVAAAGVQIPHSFTVEPGVTIAQGDPVFSAVRRTKINEPASRIETRRWCVSTTGR